MNALGARLAHALVDEQGSVSEAIKGSLICLEGSLGAGKTSFARGFIRALTQPDEEVPSPSFALIQHYTALETKPEWSIYHIDLFRLESCEEIQELGIEEALEEGVVLIEWPKKALDVMAPGYREAALHIRITGDTQRDVELFTCDRPRWQQLIETAFGARGPRPEA